MKPPCYFVDTGYLDEFFGVSGHSSDAGRRSVTAKLRAAWRARHLVFLPTVCLYELGNHVAQVDDGAARYDLAARIRQKLALCVKVQSNYVPFRLIATPDLEDWPALMDDWAQGHVQAQRGLVDMYVARRAKSFHTDRSAFHLVHIWTRDSSLKALEPDPEPDPFV